MMPRMSVCVPNRITCSGRASGVNVELVERLILGATQLTDQPYIEHDWTWHVLADHDGNEFCILQPPDDFPCRPNSLMSSGSVSSGSDVVENVPYSFKAALARQPPLRGVLASLRAPLRGWKDSQS
jgi:hypothetical protein